MPFYVFRVLLTDGDDVTEFSETIVEKIINWYKPFISQVATMDGTEFVQLGYSESTFILELTRPVDKYTLGLMLNPDPNWEFLMDDKWHIQGDVICSPYQKDLYDLLLEERFLRVELKNKIRESNLYKKFRKEQPWLPIHVTEQMVHATLCSRFFGLQVAQDTE
jgi:hypothetical protein